MTTSPTSGQLAPPPSNTVDSANSVEEIAIKRRLPPVPIFHEETVIPPTHAHEFKQMKTEPPISTTDGIHHSQIGEGIPHDGLIVVGINEVMEVRMLLQNGSAAVYRVIEHRPSEILTLVSAILKQTRNTTETTLKAVEEEKSTNEIPAIPVDPEIPSAPTVSSELVVASEPAKTLSTAKICTIQYGNDQKLVVSDLQKRILKCCSPFFSTVISEPGVSINKGENELQTALKVISLKEIEQLFEVLQIGLALDFSESQQLIEDRMIEILREHPRIESAIDRLLIEKLKLLYELAASNKCTRLLKQLSEFAELNFFLKFKKMGTTVELNKFIGKLKKSPLENIEIDNPECDISTLTILQQTFPTLQFLKLKVGYKLFGDLTVLSQYKSCLKEFSLESWKALASAKGVFPVSFITEPLEFLRDFEILEKLELVGCTTLKDEDLAVVNSLPLLRVLVVNDCNFSTEALEALKVKNPALKIVNKKTLVIPE